MMSEIIKIYEDKPSEAAIKKVVEVLKNGGLVIYPTDTVYGLGCDITNSRALEKIAKNNNTRRSGAEKLGCMLVKHFCRGLSQILTWGSEEKNP